MPGAGWYDDGTGQTRWWDGAAWTQHVAPVAAADTSTTPADTVVSAPEAAVEPLRPETPTARHALKPEDRAPQTPVTEQTFVPASFLTEQSFVPELAYAGASVAAASAPTAPSGGGASFLHAVPESPSAGGRPRAPHASAAPRSPHAPGSPGPRTPVSWRPPAAARAGSSRRPSWP